MADNFPLHHKKTERIDIVEVYKIDRDNSALYYYQIYPFLRLNKFNSYILEIVISSSFQHKFLEITFKCKTSKLFILNDISETKEFSQYIEEALLLFKREHVTLLRTPLNNEDYQDRITEINLDTFKFDWLFNSLIYSHFLLQKKLQLN